ncbi:MAG: hypothetical protein U0R68_05730 [Candidatus Nanopelagicales bacterium]
MDRTLAPRRRTALVLLAGASTLLAPVVTSAPAQAHERHHGPASTYRDVSANVDWQGPAVSTAYGYELPGVGAAIDIVTRDGGRSTVTFAAGRCTDRFAADDTYLGSTCTRTGAVTTGFRWGLDVRGLRSAWVTAADVPAQTCVNDADFNQVGDCTPTRLSVAVRWTGTGPLYRDRQCYPDPDAGTVTCMHDRQRVAAVVGVFDGVPASGPIGHNVLIDYTETTRPL